MRSTRLNLAIVLLAVALLGVYWAVSAQERPLWTPPTVLPPATKESDPKPAARFPFQVQQLPKKLKTADPTLIVPPAVYEEPRAITQPVEIKTTPNVVQAQVIVPPPMFPVNEPSVKEPAPPVIETKPPVAPIVLPASPPEPTKALIIALPQRQTPEPRLDLPPPPMLDLEPKKAVTPPPVLEPEPKKNLVAPPLVLQPEPKKNLVTPPLVVEPEPKKNQVAPPPVLEPEPKKNVVAPPLIVMPSSTPENAPATEKPKSFVRIRPNGVDPAPLPPPVRAMNAEAPANTLGPPPLQPVPAPRNAALVNLQVPTVSIEKRGPSSLHAGETQLYQIVVRNLGAVPAQQIRIEDEIPANVRLLSADPMPQVQGTNATWMLPALAPGAEQSLRLTLKADANAQVAGNTSVHVSSASVATRAHSAPSALSIRLTGPERVSVGKPAVFDIHVSNPSRLPLTGIILYGQLPEGLTSPAGNRIEGEVNESIAPGEFKVLKMPTTAVKPGRYSVDVKVVTSSGEASATATIDVIAETAFVQQAALTRLVMGRDGDLRIDVANPTDKPLRNVQVATLLPEGFVFIGASDRGLFQANSQTVHWLIDRMPVGSTKTLVARVNGTKAGQYPSVVSARADGMTEARSSGSIVLEGIADLRLRVIDRDNPLELGRETVYEIQVQNPGSVAASNVQVQGQFPAGLLPKNGQGNTKFKIDRQTVVFEPIASLAPQGQAIFRVSAIAQTAGNDQRVRFSVVSDEVRTPVQREVPVTVYSGR